MPLDHSEEREEGRIRCRGGIDAEEERRTTRNRGEGLVGGRRGMGGNEKLEEDLKENEYRVENEEGRNWRTVLWRKNRERNMRKGEIGGGFGGEGIEIGIGGVD